MLTHLQLENFRNFEKLDVKFRDGFTVFYGQNAQGKTNLLEAMFVLAFSKSFHAHDRELLRFGTPYFRVQGRTSSNELEVFYQMEPQKKALKRNKAAVSTREFLGNLKVVLFQPEDIHTFFSAPNLRRRSLNRLLSQKNPFYFQALHDYTHTLKQRNAAIKTSSALSIWNQKLVETGKTLIDERKDFVRFFQSQATKYYETISGTDKKLMMFYQPSVTPETFLCSLEKSIERDRFHGHTTVGPHRDDLVFTLDGHEVPEFTSRGELRSIVLTMKLIEAEYLTTDGEKPIFLLDDLFSELDQERSEKLLPLFEPYQVFLTTVDISMISEQMRNSACHYRVRSGNCYTGENVDLESASPTRRFDPPRDRPRNPLGTRVLL